MATFFGAPSQDRTEQTIVLQTKDVTSYLMELKLVRAKGVAPSMFNHWGTGLQSAATHLTVASHAY